MPEKKQGFDLTQFLGSSEVSRSPHGSRRYREICGQTLCRTDLPAIGKFAILRLELSLVILPTPQKCKSRGTIFVLHWRAPAEGATIVRAQKPLLDL
jgi:hypothetical protein